MAAPTSTPPLISPILNATSIPSSSLPRDRTLEEIEAGCAKIRKQLDEIEHRQLNPVLRPPRKMWPVNFKDRELDPTGPCDTDNALILQLAFQNQGFVGLARAAEMLVGDYLEDPHIEPAKNYQVISKANQDDFIRIIVTMYFDFTHHLLRGDLVWEYCHNKEFQKAVDSHHRLKKYPGTYVQALGRNETLFAPPDTRETAITVNAWRIDNPDAGGWLTAREIWKVYHAAREYMPSANANHIQSQQIDEVHQGWDKQPLSFYINGSRRYVNSGNVEKFKRWLSVWKEVYIDRIEPLLKAETKPGDNPLLDVPFRSCPFEIGWGVDVKQRANAHAAHTSSNALWTFFLALVNYLLDPDQSIFMVYRFQTNHLADTVNPIHHARIADIGMTVIARSEWHQGGFNLVPGEGEGVERDLLDQHQHWISLNAERIFRANSVFTSNMEKGDEIARRLSEHHQKVANRQATWARIEKDKQANLQRNQELRERLTIIEDATLIAQIQEAVDALIEEIEADRRDARVVRQEAEVQQEAEAQQEEEVQEEDVVESEDMYD